MLDEILGYHETPQDNNFVAGGAKACTTPTAYAQADPHCHRHDRRLLWCGRHADDFG